MNFGALFENGLSPAHVMMLAGMFVAVVIVELGYIVLSPNEDSKKRINRRMSITNGNDKMSQKNILVQLRKERGLDANGMLIMPIKSLNRLILQSGITLGLKKLWLYYVIYLSVMTVSIFLYWKSPNVSTILFPIYTFLLPYMWLKRKVKKKTAAFGAQLADAIDLITRSLKAGHPVPVAISMVAREMPDPIGTEFGLVIDEVTYGSDLVTALNNLYDRVDLPDLPLLISSISIQSTTGGNLREILEGLSLVVRERFKMKRKIKAISAEGRMSAMFLSAMPILLFFALQFMVPGYYSDIWDETLLWYCLGGLAFWMTVGNLLIMKMVSFKF